MGKFYLIEKFDADRHDWNVATPFVYDTYEEAESSLINTFEDHHTPGLYRIVEVEQYREVLRLTVDPE